MIRIKEFSEQVGFSIRMLRYLEEIEVLIPEREENNYRVYSRDQIEIARKIKWFQNLGFQLKEIQELQTKDRLNQIETIKKVLEREQEISEIKSETIPKIRNLLSFLLEMNSDLDAYFLEKHLNPTYRRTIGGEEKFHRTAYSIPILKNIYEGHLTHEAKIDLLSTDLMKFKEWFENSNELAQVYSILRESSFALGVGLSDNFLTGFERAWAQFLPRIGFQKLEDFSRDDISQIMGPHDIIIRSKFNYQSSGEQGELIIPYTPVYTLAQLK